MFFEIKQENKKRNLLQLTLSTPKCTGALKFQQLNGGATWWRYMPCTQKSVITMPSMISTAAYSFLTSKTVAMNNNDTNYSAIKLMHVNLKKLFSSCYSKIEFKQKI